MRGWLLIVLLLAGCTAPEPVIESSAPQIIVDPERPDTSYGDVATGELAEPDLNATTAAPPRLALGEWWRIQFETTTIDELVEVVRVVADVNEEGYIMGMPHEGWLKEAISFHSPSFGDVGFDLSYNTHNKVFEPVRFPLIEGDTWTTYFAAQEFTAEVVLADTYTADIVFTAVPSDDPVNPVFELFGLSGGEMRLTYDARQHEIVKMESAIGTWEVIEHGYEFEGWVTVPRGEDTAIDYGTFGPASDQHDVRPRSVEVDGTFNRMTMMHFVGSLEPSPAYIKLRHVTPGGEEWITEYQGSGYEIRFFETNEPVGTWTVEDTVAGAGFSYSMGIAYLQYDILLPDGTRRTDHGHAVVR